MPWYSNTFKEKLVEKNIIWLPVSQFLEDRFSVSLQ